MYILCNNYLNEDFRADYKGNEIRIQRKLKTLTIVVWIKTQYAEPHQTFPSITEHGQTTNKFHIRETYLMGCFKDDPTRLQYNSKDGDWSWDERYKHG